MGEQKNIIEAEDWWNPPGDTAGKKTSDEEILRVLKELKVSYPSEIVSRTGISLQTVLGRLGWLRTQGIVERVEITRWCPDDLKARLPELWALGLKGGTIRRMSWYRLVDHEADKKK